MALGKRRTDQDENEIDMTPMLDVVFIMLIFFHRYSILRQRSRPRALTVPQQQTNHLQTLKIPNIVFRISESNEITLAGRRIDIRAVRANVERLHAEKPEASVVISSHPKAKTELFVKISGSG
jgi:biopolymer transport protein ExbD